MLQRCLPLNGGSLRSAGFPPLYAPHQETFREPDICPSPVRPRNNEALADGLQALAIGKKGVEYQQLWRIQQFVAIQYRALGKLKEGMAIFDSMIRAGDEPGRRGSMINAARNMEQILISMGDVGQAEAYARRIEERVQEARGSPNPQWRAAYAINGQSWEADADGARALIFERRGQYAEAEAANRRAEAFRRASLKDINKFAYPPPPEQILQAAENSLLSVALNQAKQGLLSEAEAGARRALLGILKAQGKYNPATPKYVVGLASILVEQGRYQEAEKLARTALDVQRTIGIGDDSPQTVNILSSLGNILVAQRNAKDAAVIYAQLDKAIAPWTPQQREAFELNGSRIAALYATGQVDQGIKAAEALVKRETAKAQPGQTLIVGRLLRLQLAD